jgi:H+/gluconate symporter-like permease
MFKKLPWFVIFIVLIAWFIAVNLINPENVVTITLWFPGLEIKVFTFYGFIVAFVLGILVAAVFAFLFSKKKKARQETIIIREPPSELEPAAKKGRGVKQAL